MRDAGDSLGGWAYPLMAAMAFLETTIPPLTLVFPGEWVVLFGGAMAGEGSAGDRPADAARLGLLGGGRLGLLRARPQAGATRSSRATAAGIGLTEPRLAKVDDWLDRYGPPAVCFGRLLPLARPFGPFVAGASHFAYRRFLPWSVLGTLLFTLVFCGLGYVFYSSYDEVAATLGRGALAALVADRRRRRGRAGGAAAAARRRPRRDPLRSPSAS